MGFLDWVVKEGAKIHIDHLFEINDLEEIADELGVTIPVAIRVNMDTGIYPQWSRFGFNYDNVEAYEAVRRIFNGKKGYILDAGVNLLYTSTWYNFNIELDKRYEGLNEPSMLNGPLCMNIDIINENIQLPPLDRGSVLTISPVGAYNITQAMQFIRYRPAVVLTDNDKNVHIIKEAEELEDINHKEKIPDYLK